jgi:hypothetical protein
MYHFLQFFQESTVYVDLSYIICVGLKLLIALTASSGVVRTIVGIERI